MEDASTSAPTFPDRHALAIRLLGSYHPVQPFGRYLATLAGFSEEHILSVDDAEARFMLLYGVVGINGEPIDPASRRRPDLKGKGRADTSIVHCPYDMAQASKPTAVRADADEALEQVVTDAQTRIFAGGRGGWGAPKNALTLGFSSVRRGSPSRDPAADL